MKEGGEVEGMQKNCQSRRNKAKQADKRPENLFTDGEEKLKRIGNIQSLKKRFKNSQRVSSLPATLCNRHLMHADCMMQIPAAGCNVSRSCSVHSFELTDWNTTALFTSAAFPLLFFFFFWWILGFDWKRPLNAWTWVKSELKTSQSTETRHVSFGC